MDATPTPTPSSIILMRRLLAERNYAAASQVASKIINDLQAMDAAHEATGSCIICDYLRHIAAGLPEDTFKRTAGQMCHKHGGDEFPAHCKCGKQFVCESDYLHFLKTGHCFAALCE